MGQSRIEQLTDRHREVLRLRGRRWRVKEIAAELGIAENTANGYLSEAAALLDAGGREGAVALLLAHEAAHPESRGRFSAGDILPPMVPAAADAVEQTGPAASWRALLPLRLGAHRNELSVSARLLWIFALAVGGAVGFGALANGARVVGDLLLAFDRK